MGKLVPIVLAVVGLGAGVGAGLALKPAPEPEAAAGETAPEAAMAGGETPAAAASHAAGATAGNTGRGAAEGAAAGQEYVKLNNQFVVPVVKSGRVTSLVVMSISLQVAAGSREAVFAREPKLRDGFLQVLFEHANAGGFEGSFTASENLRSLRAALSESARSVMGEQVTDILILDMMRQDS